MKNDNRQRVCLAMAVLGLAQAHEALAETNPFYFGAAEALTREINVFRVAKGLPETNDTYSTTSLLAGIDQPISRQRIYLDAAARYNKYRHNSQLDNTGYSLDTGIDWETVESLSGRIGYTGKQNLARFGADQGPVLTTKNLERTQEFVARGQYGGASLLSLEASYVHRQLDYSAVEYDFAEFKQDAARLGLLYRPSAALTLGIAGRHTKGKYPFVLQTAPGQFQADDYTRNDADLTASWVLTGQSTVRARLSYTKETHQAVSTRDIAQSTGALSWDFKPTGKLTFTGELIRDTGAETAFAGLAGAGASAVGNNSQLSNSALLRIGYEVSAKVQLEFGGRYVQRDLINTQGGALPANGSDRYSETRAGLNWTPTRSVLLGCSIGQEQRSSDSALSYSYSARVATCQGQIRLQ
ncbi:MAG: hypothetical protein U1E89_03495 [Burkholderiaceae bacterium]